MGDSGLADMSHMIVNRIENGQVDLAVKMALSSVATGLLETTSLTPILEGLGARCRFDAVRAIAGRAPCRTWADISAILEGLLTCGMVVDATTFLRPYVEASPEFLQARVRLALLALPWMEEASLKEIIQPLFDGAKKAGWPPDIVQHLVNFALRTGDREAITSLRDVAHQRAEYPWVFRLFEYGWQQIESLENAEGPPDGGPDVYLHAALWGHRYIDNFLSYVVPALMAPGNLPRFCDGRRVTLFLDTRDGADADRLRAALEDHPISRLLTIVVKGHDDWVFAFKPGNPEAGWSKGGLEVWSTFVHLACHRAKAHDTGIIFLFPDVLMADGALGHLGDLMDGGRWDACALQNCGAEIATAGPQLEAYRQPDGSLAVPADALIDITLQSIGIRHSPTVMAAEADRVPTDVWFLVEPLADGVRITYSQHMPLFMTRAAVRCLRCYTMVPVDDSMLERMCHNGLDRDRVLFPPSFGPYAAMALEHNTPNRGYVDAPPPRDWPGAMIRRTAACGMAAPLRLQAMTSPMTCRGTGKVAPKVAPSEVAAKRMEELRRRAGALLNDQFRRPAEGAA